MELRRYGTATTIYFPLIDYGATDFEATPVTIAAGDCKISKDGGAFSNTNSNFAHVAGGIYSLALTATEMQAAQVVIKIVDQSGTKEWEDQAIVITTVADASAEIPYLADASVATVATYIDTEVAAIKAKTDNLPASPAATGDIPTAAAVADAVWDEVVSGHQTNSTFGKAFSTATTPEINAVVSTARDDIADSILKRSVTNVEASAGALTIATVILKHLSRFVASTGVIYRSNGTTPHATQAVTTDATAEPVTELGVAS